MTHHTNQSAVPYETKIMMGGIPVHQANFIVPLGKFVPAHVVVSCFLPCAISESCCFFCSWYLEVKAQNCSIFVVSAFPRYSRQLHFNHVVDLFLETGKGQRCCSGISWGIVLHVFCWAREKKQILAPTVKSPEFSRKVSPKKLSVMFIRFLSKPREHNENVKIFCAFWRVNFVPWMQNIFSKKHRLTCVLAWLASTEALWRSETRKSVQLTSFPCCVREIHHLSVTQKVMMRFMPPRKHPNKSWLHVSNLATPEGYIRKSFVALISLELSRWRVHRDPTSGQWRRVTSLRISGHNDASSGLNTSTHKLVLLRRKSPLSWCLKPFETVPNDK